MTLKTRPVIGTVYTPDGLPTAGAKIYAKLSRYELDDGMVVPSVVRAVTDVNGEYSLELWPNERGSASSNYRVTVNALAHPYVDFSIVVPDGTGPLVIESLIDRLPYPPVDVAEQAVRDAQAAASSAVANAGIATGKAAEADQSAIDAEQSNQQAQAAASGISKYWHGTQAEYDLLTPDPSVLYVIPDANT